MCIQAMLGGQMMHHHRQVTCSTHDRVLPPRSQKDELQMIIWLGDSAVI